MKRILCLTSHDLNAPSYGAVLRAKNIFKMLSQIGEVRILLAGHHENVIANAQSPQAGFGLIDKIHFPSVKYSAADRVRRKLNPRFLEIGGRQARPRDRERLEGFMAEHDLIWVHGLEIANDFGIWRWPKTVLDIDDIPSSLHRQRLSRAATLSGKYWECKQMVLWRRNEKFLAERFEAICVCSKLDRQALGAPQKVFVLPNGFDAPKKPPVRNPAMPPQIGFIGTLKYPPNRDGMRWFVDNIWPLLLERFPQARLRLAGDAGEKYFSGKNIDALGWVANMENEMANWSLAIVPVLVGGGTRIKILEAFSRKCPVVSTALGAYGYDVKDGRELSLADSPKDFAKKCIRILSNPAEGERLAGKAWIKFEQNWKWDSQINQITKIVSKVCGSAVNLLSHDVAFDVEIHSLNKPPSGIATDTSAIVDFKNMPRPRVSVIIPVFNRAHCVANAIESALNQTFNDIEIIVVDDGSSDTSLKVLKTFGDRIRLLWQRNRGVSAARNTGIRAARGNWVAFLDSDDRWHPEKLERQISALKKYSAKICFTRCVNVHNELLPDIEFLSGKLQEPEIFRVENAADAVCLSPRHPLIQTMIVKRALLEKVGLFDESFHAAEDAELIFRLSFLSGFIYIDRPLTTIYENSMDSLTHTELLGPLARRNQSYLRLLSHMYWRLAEISPEKTSIMRKRLGYFISRRAEIACAAGEMPVARTLARDGIFFARSFRDFARCAGILFLPGLVRSRAQKKWLV